jgi:hypothetical protein
LAANAMYEGKISSDKIGGTPANNHGVERYHEGTVSIVFGSLQKRNSDVVRLYSQGQIR